MKDNILIILVLVILFGAAGLLFRHGDRVINEEANEGFTQIGFVTLDDSINLEKNNFTDLQFFINNRQPKKTTYTIKYFINGELIDEQSVKLSSKKIETIILPEEVKEKIKTVSSETVEYGVEIGWKERTEKITKKY